MRTVYTSDSPQVGMAIAQPSETPQRSVVGGWGCEVKCEGEGEGRWGWAGKLKKASILSKLVYTVCVTGLKPRGPWASTNRFLTLEK